MKRITKIEVLGYAVTVTDTETNEGQRLELRGDGPWNLEDAAIAVDTRKVHRQVAPPRSDAITLRLVRGRNKVQIAAIGRGAKAWTSAQGTLLESRWELDPSGAPVAHLADRPTLVDELRAALPSVALDLSQYLTRLPLRGARRERSQPPPRPRPVDESGTRERSPRRPRRKTRAAIVARERNPRPLRIPSPRERLRVARIAPERKLRSRGRRSEDCRGSR